MEAIDIGIKYAEDVISGKIDVCKWIKRACQRYVNDLGRGDDFPFEMHADKVDRVVRFIQNLRHVEGKWAAKRKRFKLESWQIFVLSNIFGWINKETGLRRTRTVYLELPRKNGKSFFTSAIALYMLVADGEAGPQVYSAATTREQAAIVWNVGKQMVKKDQAFADHFGIQALANSVTVPDTMGVFKPLSADGNTLDGKNVHMGILDELHAHPKRDVYDVIETAMGAREQPLLWSITTAGFNRTGICYEIRSYLQKVLDKVVDDNSFFGMIYTLDEGDDWREKSSWIKANPNWGVSVNAEDFENLVKKASVTPSAVNGVLTKRFNIWCNAVSAWIDMDAVNKSIDTSLDIEDFKGQPCIIGLDLAAKLDIAAKVKLFWDEDFNITCFYDCYLPEETVESSDIAAYQGWADDGSFIVTPGNVNDFTTIRDDILQDARDFEVVACCYDPYQATQLASELGDEGIEMVEITQSVKNFSEPMKELEAKIVSGQFKFNGNQCIQWQFSNVVCKLNAKDEVYPRKEFPENKIDSIVATIMAINYLLREGSENNRGIDAVVAL